MMFDSIPHWFSRRTLTGLKLSDRYVAPPMPFALTADEGSRWPAAFPGCAPPATSRCPPGRGVWKLAAWPPLDRVGVFRRIRPSMTLLEFG